MGVQLIVVSIRRCKWKANRLTNMDKCSRYYDSCSKLLEDGEDDVESLWKYRGKEYGSSDTWWYNSANCLETRKSFSPMKLVAIITNNKPILSGML